MNYNEIFAPPQRAIEPTPLNEMAEEMIKIAEAITCNSDEISIRLFGPEPCTNGCGTNLEPVMESLEMRLKKALTILNGANSTLSTTLSRI